MEISLEAGEMWVPSTQAATVGIKLEKADIQETLVRLNLANDRILGKTDF